MSASSRFIVLFSLILSLTGCLRSHRTPDAKKSGTNFRVNEISGQAIGESENDTWKVPTMKKYEFTACLWGRFTDARLPSGQKFKVKAPNGTIFTDKNDSGTDDRGCFTWVEPINFNFAGDSSYIELNRTLIGPANYPGEHEISIGVNPWAVERGDSIQEVVDMSRNKILRSSDKMVSESNSRNGFTVFHSEEQYRNLMIQEKPNLDILAGRRVKDGRMVTIKLVMNPFMSPLNFNGNPTKHEFKSGKFRVYAQIVATGVGEVDNVKSQLLTTNLLPQTQGEDNTISINEDGSLIFEIETKLDTFTSSGQVELALKVEAVDAPFSLKPYEGLHRIGDGNFYNIFGNKAITQTSGPYSKNKFDYADLLKKSNNYDELRAAGFAHKIPAVRFSRLEPRFIRLSSGETATQRTLIYQTSTIVTDSIDGSPVAFQPFKVKRASDGVIIDTEGTDENGYLVWIDEITHLFYAPIQYFFPQPDIIHVETGYTETRTLAINPWDEGWTFGKDTRGLEEDFKRAAARKQRSPMFIIDAFRYQTIRFRYVIDEFLTLNVKKAVVMTFDPLIQRFGIQKDRYFEPLRDGIYLMKIALVKYYIDPFKNKTYLTKAEDGTSNSHVLDENGQKIVTNYVLKDSGGEQIKDQFTTVVKKLIRVQGGRITTPVEFSMKDLRMMSIRNNLIVQIETIDENKLMKDNIIDSKIRTLMEEYENFNSEGMTETEKDEFLEQKRLELLENKDTLLAEMEEELRLIKQEREKLEEPYFKLERFQRLEEFQNYLESDDLYEFENFKNTMNLKKEEFSDRIEKARAAMEESQAEMNSFWTEWSEAYLTSLKEGEVTEGLFIDGEEARKKSEEQDQAEMDQYEESKGLGLAVVPEENRFARVSYFDYLASLQLFSKESSLGIGASVRDFEQLRINNYTENPAAPFIDLDLYKNDAGLAPRAFIGPCTLVENDNMSDMRPTDTLDERASGRMDSSEILYEPRFVIDNSRFENSAYHDSLSPFKNNLDDEVTLLDKYIGEHIENEMRYERQMDAIAQMGNFTKSYNLEYVSLELDGKPRKLQIFDDGCTFEDGKVCLKDRNEDQMSKESFKDHMNSSDMWSNLKRYFYLNPMKKLKRENKKLLEADNAFKNIWEELYDSTSSLLSNLKFLPVYTEDHDLEDDFDPSHSTYYYRDAKEFLDTKLDGKFRAFETFDAAKWLSGGLKELRLVDAIRLCSTIAKQNITALEQAPGNLIDPEAKTWFRGTTPYQYLLDSCLSSVKYLPESDQVHMTGLTFDRRYRVIKPGEYRHIAGKSMNINVGADIGISNYEDIGSAASLGTNGALLGLAAGLVANSNQQQKVTKGGLITAVGKAPHPLAKLLKGALLVGGGLFIADKATSEAQGLNFNFSTSISEAVFLVVQKAEMLFTIEQHEKCLISQFTSKFISNLDLKKLGVREGVKKTNPELIKRLSRGFVICGGKVFKKPETVIENFYYVTQHFTAGDMLDEANLLNHVWLLALRGTHDYNNFLRVLKANYKNRDGDVEKNTEQLYEYPLHHLNKVYEKVTPSFPGMYSVPISCNSLVDKGCK